MSEEEIIKIIKYMLKNKNTDINVIINYEAIKGLLDLYNKEKNKNKLLLDLYNKEKSLNKMIKSKTFKDICYNIGQFDNRFISKDKIRELRDIDDIDLIQFKLIELLEE